MFKAVLQAQRTHSCKKIGTFKLHIFTTLFALLVLTAGAVEDARPNILLIMADDMGFSDKSSYGSEIPTPNLDLLSDNNITKSVKTSDEGRDSSKEDITFYSTVK